MARRINIDGNTINIPEVPWKLLFLAVIIILGGVVLFSSFYTVEANENAVILRFGKFAGITEPGLHLKLPYGIDKVYKVKVAYQYKEEFGFQTLQPGIRSIKKKGDFRDESWMLTGDLNIAEVKWIVQYNIKDPAAYLFKVRDVENTIRDVAESTMRLMIGDRSFHEVVESERQMVADHAEIAMQEILDSYEAGIDIQLVQLQDVLPPAPVADSFNEVNRAKQEQETLVNEARQGYNKEIYRAEGEAAKMIKEAEGYAIERVNNAKGDVALFAAVLKEYQESPDITQDRLYYETMEKVLARIPEKTIIDSRLESVLPLLNLDGKGGK